MGPQYKLGITLLALLFFSGCASLSNFQTAETLEQGESVKSINFTMTTVDIPENTSSAGFNESVQYYVPEFAFRIGVYDNIDVGLKIYPMSAVFDAKYQFIDQNDFDLAFDLGLSQTSIESGNTKTEILDIYPTVLLSYNMSSNASVTLAPKMILRSTTSEVNSNTNTESTTITGATLTFAFGKGAASGNGFKFMPEFGVFSVDGASFTTVGLGFTY